MGNMPNCEDVGCLGCGGENKTRCPCGNLSTHVAILEEGLDKDTIYFRCSDCAHQRFAAASVFYSHSQLDNYLITDEKVEKVRELLIARKAKLA